MLGPVFLLEWKSAARRSRHFRFRFAYAVVVAAEFAFFLFAWLSRGFDPFAGPATPWRVTGGVVADYLPLFTLQHLLLLLLVTPALAAGSISDEKARGSLTLLLTTELTAREIVFGKCLGQAAQVLALALPAVPVIAFLQALSGLPPAVAGAWLIESAALALFLAALSLLSSVWARKTTSAVIVLYIALTAALAGAWLAGFGGVLDQLVLVQPAPPGVSTRWPALMLAAVVVATGCLIIAAWRLRPACAADGAPRPRRRWWGWFGRPPVSVAPVRWKERYVGELGVLAFARKLPRWAAVGLTLSLGLLALWLVPGDDRVFLWHGLGMITVVGVLVAVRSSGAITRERERQTWEGLLLTPLEPYSLVRGKVWGIIDSLKPYLLAYLAGTLVWATPYGLWAVLCTVACWLVAWPFLYLQAAQGVYHSARSASSWRAMLFALASCTAALAVETVGAAAALFFVAAMALPLSIGTNLAGYLLIVVVAIVGICGLMMARAEYLLVRTERHIAEQDRVVQSPYPRRAVRTALPRPAVR